MTFNLEPNDLSPLRANSSENLVPNNLTTNTNESSNNLDRTDLISSPLKKIEAFGDGFSKNLKLSPLISSRTGYEINKNILSPIRQNLLRSPIKTHQVFFPSQSPSFKSTELPETPQLCKGNNINNKTPSRCFNAKRKLNLTSFDNSHIIHGLDSKKASPSTGNKNSNCDRKFTGNKFNFGNNNSNSFTRKISLFNDSNTSNSSSGYNSTNRSPQNEIFGENDDGNYEKPENRYEINEQDSASPLILRQKATNIKNNLLDPFTHIAGLDDPLFSNKIFNHLSGKELREAASVSKLWFNVIHNNSNCRKKVLEYIRGFEPRREDLIMNDFGVFSSPIRPLFTNSKNKSKFVRPNTVTSSKLSSYQNSINSVNPQQSLFRPISPNLSSNDKNTSNKVSNDNNNEPPNSPIFTRFQQSLDFSSPKSSIDNKNNKKITSKINLVNNESAKNVSRNNYDSNNNNNLSKNSKPRRRSVRQRMAAL